MDTFKKNLKMQTAASGSSQLPNVSWALWDSMQWYRDYIKNRP